MTAQLFDGERPRLTPEEEEQKRAIYERMSPRRRKFVDRLGYTEWDPFQKPNEPLDMRTDATKRTARQLMHEFLASPHAANTGDDFRKGALDCALGLVNNDEKTLGALAFSLWYHDLLHREKTRP